MNSVNLKIDLCKKHQIFLKDDDACPYCLGLTFEQVLELDEKFTEETRKEREKKKKTH